ncbi:MAG: F0F1 ATP synthase subunit epsilon [Acidiferrobacteraceae bacterium]
MATIHVDIVSAEREIFSGEAQALFAPLALGEVGILPRHTPLLGRLRPGEVRVQTSEGEQQFYVTGGLLEVQPTVATVLADTAMRAHDLDEVLAHEAVARAEEALANRGDTIDYARAQAALVEAMERLRIARKYRGASPRR